MEGRCTPSFEVAANSIVWRRATPLKVETLPGKVGGKITFEDVLPCGTDEKQLLTGPNAAKAKVVGKIIAQGRHPKITVLKFKTCGQYKISRGHRQNYTAVQVSGIEL